MDRSKTCWATAIAFLSSTKSISCRRIWSFAEITGQVVFISETRRITPLQVWVLAVHLTEDHAGDFVSLDPVSGCLRHQGFETAHPVGMEGGGGDVRGELPL